MSDIVSAEDARRAVDSLDDFARMDVAVHGAGAVRVLLNYIEQREAAIAAAVAAEREACAKVCEGFGGNGAGFIDDDWARMCAEV